MPESVGPGVAMGLNDFVSTHAQTESGGSWQLESSKMLEIHLNNEQVYTKLGAMVAYYGALSFERASAGSVGKFMKKALTGEGGAITTHGKPIVLGVSPQSPLFTDPNATVAWSEGMQTSVLTDVSLKTLTGRASGETFQMRFDGTGFVVLQPYEEVVQAGGGG